MRARPLVLSLMMHGRFAVFAIASSVLIVVPAVPAFSQSANLTTRANVVTPYDTDRARTGVARVLYTDAPSHSSAVIPPNLIVAPVFRGVVDSMLRGSATFRRQCSRIAHAPGMTIALDWFRPHATEHVRARTVLSTTPDGQRRATVGIRPLDDPIELIAHELEHVIEQLDAVDLHTLATVPESGVRKCDCEGQVLFETIRAIRAGRAAAEEVRRHGG
jgi:hypothetical protein